MVMPTTGEYSFLLLVCFIYTALLSVHLYIFKTQLNYPVQWDFCSFKHRVFPNGCKFLKM